MRAWLPDFDVRVARDVNDALARLDDGWTPLAGGTDVMVVLAAGHLPPARYVSIWGIGLDEIVVGEHEVVIGGAATYSQISAHPVLAAEFPMLGIAARASGALAIQNRGTIGGNVANASPAADTPPALIAYGAEVELLGRRGRRRVPYVDFHTGYKATVRGSDELIAGIVVPRRGPQPHRVEHYRKVGTRKAQAIAKVGLAVAMDVVDGEVVRCAVGLSSVAPYPLVARGAAAALVGRRLADALDQSVTALGQDATPIDDVRSTASYRRTVAQNLWRDLLESTAAGRAPAPSP